MPDAPKHKARKKNADNNGNQEAVDPRNSLEAPPSSEGSPSGLGRTISMEATSRGTHIPIIDASFVPQPIYKNESKYEGERRGRRRAPTGRKVRFALADHDAAFLPDPLNVVDLSEDLAPAAGNASDNPEEFQMIMNMPPDAEAENYSKDSEDSSDDPTRKMDAAVEAISADFSLNPITLTFRDGASEAKYVNFVIEHKSFVAGKLYTLMSGVVSLVLLFPYLSFHLTAEKMQSFYVVFLFSSVSVSWLILVLFFLKVTLPIREYLFFFSVAIHWPAFAGTSIMMKEDKAYRYAYTSGCFVFCCFIAQPRFVAMFPFLTLTPTVTLFVATFTSHTYWEENNRMEMVYWLIPLFPLFMLRIFERRSREAFVENERGKATMDVLNQRSAMTKKLLARFFPLTATVRLLKTHGSEQYGVYTGTALMFSTVDGFLEWAAQTNAEIVVARVAQMFITMEKLAKRYGIEKVSTIGDTYFGACFPQTILAGRRRSATEEVNRQTAAIADNNYSPYDSSLEAPHHERHLPCKKRTNEEGIVVVAAIDDSPSSDGGDSPHTEELPHAGTDSGSVADTPTGPNPPGLIDSSVGGNDKPSSSSRRRQSTSTTTSSNSARDRATSERAHRVLRFATAVRHHKDVMPVKIGVHIGAVIGGFVGIQPPKFDLFGVAVQRVKLLEHKGKKRRIHASQEIIDAATGFGRPSDDFEASDVDGQIFSSWRASRDAGTTSAS
jgi:class 3 adenylate cyclase